jgi:hypothetical protein
LNFLFLRFVHFPQIASKLCHSLIPIINHVHNAVMPAAVRVIAATVIETFMVSVA